MCGCGCMYGGGEGVCRCWVGVGGIGMDVGWCGVAQAHRK